MLFFGKKQTNGDSGEPQSTGFRRGADGSRQRRSMRRRRRRLDRIKDLIVLKRLWRDAPRGNARAVRRALPTQEKPNSTVTGISCSTRNGSSSIRLDMPDERGGGVEHERGGRPLADVETRSRSSHRWQGDGPWVIDVGRALALAARRGLFTGRGHWQDAYDQGGGLDCC